jgi:hypothetical protein
MFVLIEVERIVVMGQGEHRKKSAVDKKNNFYNIVGEL